VVTTAGNWARGLFNSSEYTSRPGLTPHDFVYDLYQAFLPYAPAVFYVKLLGPSIANMSLRIAKSNCCHPSRFLTIAESNYCHPSESSQLPSQTIVIHQNPHNCRVKLLSRSPAQSLSARQIVECKSQPIK
jgi:hypothetical protein